MNSFIFNRQIFGYIKDEADTVLNNPGIYAGVKKNAFWALAQALTALYSANTGEKLGLKPIVSLPVAQG